MAMLMNHDEHLWSRSVPDPMRHFVHIASTNPTPGEIPQGSSPNPGDPSISIMGGRCSMVFPTSGYTLLGKCWESSIQCLLGIQTLLKSLGFFGSQVSHLGQYLHVPCSKMDDTPVGVINHQSPGLPLTFHPVQFWPKQSQLLVWNLRIGGKTPFFLGQTSIKNNWAHTKKH